MTKGRTCVASHHEALVAHHWGGGFIPGKVLAIERAAFRSPLVPCRTAILTRFGQARVRPNPGTSMGCWGSKPVQSYKRQCIFDGLTGLAFVSSVRLPLEKSQPGVRHPPYQNRPPTAWLISCHACMLIQHKVWPCRRQDYSSNVLSSIEE